MNDLSLHSREVTRRDFLTTTATVGGGILIGSPALGQPASAARRRRYALVGLGGRSRMYREAVLKTYAQHHEMVVFCDVNLGRLRLAQSLARKAASVEVPIYDAKEDANAFDRMVLETKPDVVIVTTKDAAHRQYIIRAMELGSDVMTEKPMTTDEQKCRAIFEAQRPEKEKCTFYLDLAANPELEYKELHLDQEKYDGYFRDRCVFRPDIDIEDTMNVHVRYNTGVTMAYSLNAFNAWEGYIICFNGTKGRLQHKAEEVAYFSGDGSVPGAIKPEGTYIRICPLRAAAYEVPVWSGEGGHGGGDDVMLADLFLPEKKPDKYQRGALTIEAFFGPMTNSPRANQPTRNP
ncbi:MAG: Gfo/Idh/MocA family oxidoreductase [Verrucomicrobiota bacterium]